MILSNKLFALVLHGNEDCVKSSVYENGCYLDASPHTWTSDSAFLRT